MPPPKPHVGAYIRLHRTAREWSQSALGDRSGMTGAAISDIERGGSTSSRNLEAIATAFGMANPGDLWTAPDPAALTGCDRARTEGAA